MAERPQLGNTVLPVFYINLARRTDRRDFMERQFQRLGIAAERIEATTIADLTPTQRAAAEQSIWGQSPASLACSLSHRLAWCAIVERRLDAAVILEDDVVLAEDFGTLLKPEALDRAGVSLLRLETFGRRVRLGSASASLSDTYGVRRLITTHPGSAAYMVARPIAAAAAADPDALLMEVDRYLFGRGGRWLTEIAVGQAIPAPCIQLDRLGPRDGLAASDIAARRRDGAGGASPRARRARRARNLAYSLAVAARLIADPAALFAPRLTVPFAGADPGASA